MTRADAVLCAAAAVAGPGLGVFAWLMTGGAEASSPELIWAWNWLLGALAVPIALLLAGRPAVLPTALVNAFLSILGFGAAMTLSVTSTFGPTSQDGAAQLQIVLSAIAAVVARYVGTRSGAVPGLGVGVAAAVLGGAVALVATWFAGGGLARLLSHVVPCSGLECGVTTGLLSFYVLLLVSSVGGALVGLQLVRRVERESTS